MRPGGERGGGSVRRMRMARSPATRRTRTTFSARPIASARVRTTVAEILYLIPFLPPSSGITVNVAVHEPLADHRLTLLSRLSCVRVQELASAQASG
jgi:hypothetical protein